MDMFFLGFIVKQYGKSPAESQMFMELYIILRSNDFSDKLY